MTTATDDLPTEVAAAFADFRRSLIRRGRSPATVEVYAKSYRNFWTWALGNEAVEPNPSAVTYKHLNDWTDHLLTAKVIRNGRPVLVVDPETGDHVEKALEPATRRILFQNLRPFYSWWVREEGGASPFDRADRPPPDRDPAVPLVPLDDVRRLLDTCASKDFTDRRDEALIRVLIDTGARRGELTGLRVTDWDSRNDLLALDGKTGPRTVPVSLSTGEALGRYRRRRAEHRLASHPALWLGPKGALGDSAIAQLLKRRCEMAGVAHINPHKLRHTWAHLFRAEGGAEGDLMYLAGWSSTEMAHRYGRSAAMERAQQAARRIRVGDRL